MGLFKKNESLKEKYLAEKTEEYRKQLEAELHDEAIRREQAEKIKAEENKEEPLPPINNNDMTILGKPFLMRRKKFLWLIPYGKPYLVDGNELVNYSPLLLYIDENKDIQIFENIRSGVLKVTDKDGEPKGYENRIETRKMCNLLYDGQRIPTLVHYEKEYYSYPHEPKLDAEEVSKTIRLLQANYKLLDERTANAGKTNWMQILKIVGIGALIIIGAVYLGMILGVWDYLFPQTAVNATVNATMNSSGVVAL